MSRSYKKHPYYQVVAMKDSTRKSIKRMSNRSLRRRMNQGLLDDDLMRDSNFKRITDNEYTYDLFKMYASDEHKNEEWYRKVLSK